MEYFAKNVETNNNISEKILSIMMQSGNLQMLCYLFIQKNLSHCIQTILNVKIQCLGISSKLIPLSELKVVDDFAIFNGICVLSYGRILKFSTK